MPVGSGKNNAQSTRVPLSKVCCILKLCSGNTLRIKPSNCTSPYAPRLFLSPNNSCKLTILLLKPSIFFWASSMVARRCITLTKVSLVFLKPSSKRSETLPPISSKRASTTLLKLSMLCVSVVVAFNMVSLIKLCCDLPCSAKVICSFSSTVSRVCARLLVCSICSFCRASRVEASSCATLAFKRSLLSCAMLFKRSPNLFKPSCKSISMALCFSSRRLSSSLCCCRLAFVACKLCHTNHATIQASKIVKISNIVNAFMH